MKGTTHVELGLGDLRALEGVGLGGVTNLDRLDLGHELLHELLLDALLDEDSRSSAADLSGVEEDPERRPGSGSVEVGVLEDDVGRLSSELEGDGLEVALGGELHDSSTDEGGSGEGNLLDFLLHEGRLPRQHSLGKKRNESRRNEPCARR